jgi:hypothetical protein
VHYGSLMPRMSRGPRIPLTIRLPFDLYREVSIRAKGRNWSLSDFVAYCVAKEISGKYPASRVTVPNNSHAAQVAEEWMETLDG